MCVWFINFFISNFIIIFFMCICGGFIIGSQYYIWTSGHKCNFKGCERADLQPVSVYGWFWTGSLVRLPATTDRLDSDWSDTGG